MKLELELIPETTWGQSLAHLLPKPVWDTLRREVYREFEYTCAICNASNTRMNCHEVWFFQDKKHIQYLRGFQALCDDCHNVKHWGRTVTMVHQGVFPNDYLQKLTKHFCAVNECTEEEFLAHKVERGTSWEKRSKHKYKIDFGKFTPERLVKAWKKSRGGK